MSGRFAVLEYAEAYPDFIASRAILKTGSKKLMRLYAKRRLPYAQSEFSILGAEGVNVTLPLTAEDAENEPRHKNDIYLGVLNALAQEGVNAVKSIRGSKYEYDDIIVSASGFYILPFLLPEIIRKRAKAAGIEARGLEILVIDGITDLTNDILCVISGEVNHITVFTDNTEYFQKIAYKFYCDSGLTINVADNRADPLVGSADIILNASAEPDSLANRYKNGSFFLDMCGNVKKITALSSARGDMVCADGAELKAEGRYMDNILLETVLLSNNPDFSAYVFGSFSDGSFYGALDYVESLCLRLTAFLRGGKRI